MDMGGLIVKVELLAIIKDRSTADTSAIQSIYRAFASISSDTENFRVFEEQKSFFAEMGKAFSRASVIAAAADEASFLEQKWNILKALGLKSEICPAVMTAIKSSVNTTDSSMKAHALMPKDAAVFLTRDGLYSGFAVQSGKQTLLFLPLSGQRTREILQSGVLPYFEEKNAPDEPQKPAEPEKPQIELPDNTARFAQTARMLSDANLTVAFASTQTNVFLQNGLRANPRFGDSFVPAAAEDDPGSRESGTERIACLADNARQEIGTPLGAAISNIYSLGMEKQELFMFISLADSQCAHVRKITGTPDMNTNELVTLATDELYEMLQLYAAGEPFPPEDVQVIPLKLHTQTVEEKQEGEKQKRSTGAKIAVCVLIALILCVLIGFYFKDQVAALFMDGAAHRQAAVVDVTETTRWTLPDGAFAEEEESTEDAEEEADLALFGAADPAAEGVYFVETPAPVQIAMDVQNYYPTAGSVTPSTTLPAETTTAAIPEVTTAPETTTAAPATTTAAPKVTGFTLAAQRTAKPAEVKEETTEKPTVEAAQAETVKDSAEKASTTVKESTTKETTTKATTTKPSTTRASLTLPTTATTAAPAAAVNPFAQLVDSAMGGTSTSAGTITFTVYGYGHGVGMSQLGALAYSRQGWDYKQILFHYYPGTTLMRETPPAEVTYNGKPYTAEDLMTRVVLQEIGGYCRRGDENALKAQAVAAYSFMKMRGYSMGTNDMARSNVADSSIPEMVRSAVRSVLGEYLTYNGRPITAQFFASSAGKTTSSANAWGGTSYAYLAGGVDSAEQVSVTTVTISAADFRAIIDAYNRSHPDKKITLSGSPSQWLEILSHDGARGDVGYISSIRVGDKTMSGNTFRTMFNSYRKSGTNGIRSHCFSLSFT